MMHRSAADAVSSRDVVTFVDLPDGYIRLGERSKCRWGPSSESREEEKDIPPEHKDRTDLIPCSRLWDPRLIPQTGENLTEGLL